MKKTTLIIVVVLILIVLGGGAFYLMGRSQKSPSQSTQNATSQNQASQMSTQKKSLFDFFSMAGSQKCTFSDKTNGGSGSVYVVPTTITFTDYSAMMQGAVTGAAMHPSSAMNGNQAACSQCDQVPAGA